MTPTEYTLLVQKALIEEISENERSILAKWLEENSAHARQAEEIRALWKMVGEAVYFPPVDETHLQKQRERLYAALQRSSVFK